MVIFHFFGDGKAFSQTDSLPAISQNYVMEIWDNSNGLPQNAVYAMEKDNHGYLWIATEEGLVRLDGTNPKVYDQETHPLMIEQTYYNFFKTSSGIWAAADRSIVLLEKNLLQVINCDQIAKNTWIRAIAETSKKDLLIGTQKGKIYNWRDKEFSELAFWNPSGTLEILSFYSIQPEKILVGTTRGLYELDMIAEKSKLISEETLSAHKIFGTPEALFISDPTQGIFRLTENYQTELVLSFKDYKDIDISSLSTDAKNRIWAGSLEKGLIVVNGKTVSRFTYPELKNYTIRKIIIEDKALYLGTLGKGLAIVKSAKVKQLEFEVLRDKNIKAIFQAKDSSYWIGTRTDGLHRIKGKSIQSFTSQVGFLQQSVTTIGESKGKIYTGSPAGITVIDSKNLKILNTIKAENGLKSDHVQVIYEDTKGWLWILTRFGGIHYFDPQGNLQTIELPEKNARTSFISLEELKNGQIIVGSINGGAFRIQNGKIAEHYNLPLSPGEDVIYDIYEDRKGDLWFATHGGIIFYSQGTFKSLKKANGLKSKSVYSITPDPSDGIWITNNFGAQYFSSDELEYFKEAPNSDFFLGSTLYNDKLGLPNSEANGLIFPSSIRDFGGKIWIPTVEGVGIIDPFTISDSTKEVTNFVWDELTIGDQVTPIYNEIRIPKGIKMFQVSFSLIDFENPSQYSLFYRLDKKSGPWTPIKDERQLNFNGLAPGKYNLELIILRYGRREATLTIPILVEASFFETPLFWLIIAISSILLIYFIFQHYFNKRMKNELEAKVELRTRELSHTNEKLKDAVKEIEDQNSLLKEITWNQSHLVRAPLTKAMGINQLLIKYPYYSNVRKSKEQLEIELLETLRQLDQIVKETHSISENLKRKDGE